ncbi:esterase family protein [Bacillaceae bacterium Marseille-Q3522]|nr:esterase family protein [Bacillaceae bacterium Marseille-Q3522]
MALLKCYFPSDALLLKTSMTVILPDLAGAMKVEKRDHYPTLYLLHGLSDDDTMWLRRTNIERYASAYGLAVVIPQVHRSFYMDMAYGNKYWTFLSEELPEIARAYFPLSDKREENFVAGLSMGGYGALKWAFRKPEQFAAVASMSGVVDIINIKNIPEVPLDDYQLIFGNQPINGTENDLFYLLKQLDKKDTMKPKVFQCCGTEDFLYNDNVKFRDACQQANLDFTYQEEKGTHDWDYWDKKIQDVLAWLPL